MKRARIRFYADLNDFLAPWRQGRASDYDFLVSGSVKDLIESLGVPHTEVDLILVNGEPVGFGYRVQDRDHISVYPPFRYIDVSPLLSLRPEALEKCSFVVDTHLGRLAAYLRMLGFDTWYRRDSVDDELAAISADEDRILLTRDRGLLKRNMVKRGYYVQAIDPARQLVEVLQRFNLAASVKPFRRCTHCNAMLKTVSKDAVAERLLPETRQFYDEFYLCPCCGHVYWKGSHYRRMQRFIDSVLTAN
jgi:uncharacterized protein with PIN domain